MYLLVWSNVLWPTALLRKQTRFSREPDELTNPEEQTNAARLRKELLTPLKKITTFKDYDLTLITISTTNAIPQEGKNSVIVAKINSAYHARIFDGHGNHVTKDKDEKLSPDATLKQQLEQAFSNSSIDKAAKKGIDQSDHSTLRSFSLYRTL